MNGKKENQKREIQIRERTAGHYLAHLIGCALRGVKAREKPDSITWEQVYSLAVSNSVEGISYFGLKGLEAVHEAGLLEKWKSAMDMTVYRLLHFDTEREAILSEMRSRGLCYLPLKGIRMAYYYPVIGMRSMADNDILYGFVEEDPAGGFCIRGGDDAAQEASVKAAQDEMVSIMKRRGYDVGALTGNHDSYYKKPFFNFEMHRKLASKGTFMWEYYENPWKRAIRDERDTYTFSFSDEDEYVYIIAHTFKHFDHSGCGIRSAVDQYVFLHRENLHMDMGYVEQELKKLGLNEFAESMRSMGEAVFGGVRKMTDSEKQLLYHMLGCGTYGNIGVKVSRNMDKLRSEGRYQGSVKLAYLRERIYPTDPVYRDVFPLFYKYKLLYPFLPLYRVGRGLLHNPRMLWAELKVWSRVKK